MTPSLHLKPQWVALLLATLGSLHGPAAAQGDRAVLPIIPFAENSNLPSPATTALLETKEGSIWIGTDKGLAYYNGNRLTVFRADPRHPNALKSDLIAALCETSDQTLWVAQPHALEYKQAFSSHFIELPLAKQESQLHTSNRRLLVETAGGKLVYGTDVGISIIDIASRTVEAFLPHSENPFVNLFSMVERRNGELLLGTNVGIWRLDLASLEFSRTTLRTPSARPFDKVSVQSLFIDSAQNIWIGSLFGIFGIDKTETAFGPLREGKRFQGRGFPAVDSIAEDGEGNIWLGTPDSGAYRARKSSIDFQPVGGPSDSIQGASAKPITRILPTRSGHVLIGTQDEGLWQQDLYSLPVTSLHTIEGDQGPLVLKNIRILSHDPQDNDLWLVSEIYGLCRYSLDTREFQSHIQLEESTPSDPTEVLSNIVFTSDGDMVFSSDDNLVYRWDPNSKRLLNLKSTEHTLRNYFNAPLKIDSQGRLWRLGGKPYAYDFESKIKTEINRPDLDSDGLNDRSFDVVTDAKGNAWISTRRSGILFYDFETDRIDVYPPLVLNHDSNHPYEDMHLLLNENELWIGSRDGLRLFDTATRRLVQEHAYPELQNQAIVGIVRDDIRNQLWFASPDSIYSRSDDSNDLIAYDRSNNLQAAAYNDNTFQLLEGGRLAIAGWNGIDILSPHALSQKRLTSRPALTRVEVNGEEFPFKPRPNGDTRLRLNYKQTNVSIEFAAAFPLNTKGQRFEYRLDQADEAWIPAPSTNLITLKNLSHGEKTLELRTFPVSKESSPIAMAVAISISPPLYASLGFRVASVGALGLIVGAYLRMRSRELKRINKMLKEEVEKRTRDLEKSREEALVAQQRAEAASRTKSEFLATMSHEIRTPMNGILGMNQLILESSPAPNILNYAKTISQSAETMLVLLNDLLDLSKIEANKVELESVPFDLRSLCEELADLLAVKAFEKGIGFHMEVKAEIPTPLLGDPHRIKQAITNLIGNAIKFTDKGHVGITIEVSSDSENSTRLRVEVSDTGIGISPEAIASLFNSFTQADASTTRKFGGTGLGLSISKQLVELMGGEIGCRSEEGKGSVFFFTVELDKAYGAAPTPGLNSPVAESPKILFLGPRSRTYRWFEYWAQKWGCPVSSCESTSEAIEAIEAAAAKGNPFHRIVIHGSRLKRSESSRLAEGLLRFPGILPIMLRRFNRSHEAEIAQVFHSLLIVTQPIKPEELKRAIANQAPTRSTAQQQTGQGKNSPKRSNAKVLVVDDNETNRKVAAAMLKKLGITPEYAVNGLEAVKICQEKRFDLVLMDCMMPVLDGYDATRQIRTKRDNPNYSTPIVALTANAMQGDRESCLQAGMTDHLEKPLRTTNLYACIQKFIPLEQEAEPSSEVTSEGPSHDLLPPEPEPLNMSQIYDLFDGDNEEIASLLETFQSRLSHHAAILQRGSPQSDHEEKAISAHALKGMAGNCDAMILSDLASSLEQAYKTGQTDNVPVLLNRFLEQAERAALQIDAVLKAAPTK